MIRAGLVVIAALVAGLASTTPTDLHAQQDAVRRAGQRIVATSSLAAKEYAIGVVDGRVVLAAEVEEARLFLLEAEAAADGLPLGLQAPARDVIAQMRGVVREVGEPERLTALADSVERFLSANINGLAEALPDFRPDRTLGATLYRDNCADCHGARGGGDGPRAGEMDPPPSDLSDWGALSDLSTLDFYRKILLGVAGTDMPSHEGALTDAEIWAVASYAGELRLDPAAVARGRDVVEQRMACATCGRLADGRSLSIELRDSVFDPSVVATMSDDALVAAATARVPDLDSAGAVAVASFLRTLPAAHDGTGHPAIARSLVRLGRGVYAAEAGEAAAAAQHFFDAYVEFEGVERDLALRDAALAATLEFRYADIRSRAASGDDVAAGYLGLKDLLAQAEAAVAPRVSATGLATQSFVLLFREGVEALLIIGALATLLVRAGAGERRKELGYGVAAALVASVATAVGFETVFRIGVAQQELLEGITMLVAAGVLLFVSYWLISKIEISHWKAFVARQGDRALQSGSRFALMLAAFLAVYREGFETVLFYKALFITSDGAGAGAILGGAVVAVGALSLLWLAMTRFGYRIPIRSFFAVTSAVLMYMSFAFVGKGIAELQGSALVSTTVIEWAPSIPWMGIYPTIQTLAWQLMIVALIGAGLAWTFLLQPRLARRWSERRTA